MMTEAAGVRNFFYRLVFIPACLALGGIPSGRPQAAPQTFNSALPVAKDAFVFREQFLYRRATDDPGRADRELGVKGGISVLGYGISGAFAVFGVVPWLHNSLDLTTMSGMRINRDTRGFGDARLFGRYTAYRSDTRGRTFRVAPFAGIELPTGDDNDRDNFGRLPPTLQLGSGSWDPFGGVVATWQTLEHQIDAQLSYKRNTRANNFRFGDEARFDASFQYRLWPRTLGQGVPGFLYGVIEGNFVHQGKNEFNGADNPDSGGESLFLSPGLQYVTKRWVAEAIVQVPTFQNLNGSALEDNFIIRAGFRFNF